MHTLPTTMVQVLAPFTPLFSKRIFQDAQLLLIGAILAPGRRTVSSALRAMGLDQYKRLGSDLQTLTTPELTFRALLTKDGAQRLELARTRRSSTCAYAL